MHICDLFQKGKVKQVLTLDGEWIFLPDGTFKNGAKKYKPCTSVRQFRKMFKTEKEMFNFIKNHKVDICIYMI